MADEYTTKPLTLETLEKYNKKVLLPEIKGIVDERMQHYTNEILNDNDRELLIIEEVIISKYRDGSLQNRNRKNLQI